MPIFEYVCNCCGHRFDVIEGLDSADCPSCENEKTTKQFSPNAALRSGRKTKESPHEQVAALERGDKKTIEF